MAKKSGLNRSIQQCRWSKLKTRIASACEQQGTAYFEVRAANSSLRCSQCGNTCRENRKSQAEFLCIKCGYQDNADRNAALNHATAANPQLYQHLTWWMRRKRPPNRNHGGGESPRKMTGQPVNEPSGGQDRCQPTGLEVPAHESTAARWSRGEIPTGTASQSVHMASRSSSFAHFG